ncbi:hypothetical protein [Paraburkholderia strydomiana]
MAYQQLPWLTPSFAPQCPLPLPTLRTTLISILRRGIGALGKIKAGELVAKGNIVARNVYEKYPGISQDFLAQTMAATYCSMLSSGGFTSKQRADRWNTFQTKVLGLSVDQPSIASDTTGNKLSAAQDRARHDVDVTTAGQVRDKPTALDKLVDRLSGGALRFQVGTDQLDARSTTYLQTIALHLHQFDNVVISLEPIQSKGINGDTFTADARALYKGRQQQARQVLIGAGFASDQIIFVNNIAFGKASNDVYDAAGNPIEAGLVVQISNDTR